jgi:hypothetical protein
VELRAVERGRTCADDPDAVAHFLVRQLLAVQVARDDGHVVLVRERLAELGEELRGRLDARPVVLVEHKEPGTRRAHRANGNVAPWPRRC